MTPWLNPAAIKQIFVPCWWIWRCEIWQTDSPPISNTTQTDKYYTLWPPITELMYNKSIDQEVCTSSNMVKYDQFRNSGLARSHSRKSSCWCPEAGVLKSNVQKQKQFWGKQFWEKQMNLTINKPSQRKWNPYTIKVDTIMLPTEIHK